MRFCYIFEYKLLTLCSNARNKHSYALNNLRNLITYMRFQDIEKKTQISINSTIISSG